jgi:hypothetical protein
MAKSFELINSISVGSGGAANIDFTSIPQTYTDLCLRFSSRTTHNNTPDDWYMTVNNDGASVYSYRMLYGSGSGVGTIGGSATGGIYAGWTDASPNTSNTFANTELYFPNYTSSDYKNWYIDGVYEQNGTTAYQYLNGCLFSKTTAISSIKLVGFNASWAQYTTAYLYGINKS